MVAKCCQSVRWILKEVSIFILMFWFMHMEYKCGLTPTWHLLLHQRWNSKKDFFFLNTEQLLNGPMLTPKNCWKSLWGAAWSSRRNGEVSLIDHEMDSQALEGYYDRTLEDRKLESLCSAWTCCFLWPPPPAEEHGRSMEVNVEDLTFEN